jgi:hypothetical protein
MKHVHCHLVKYESTLTEFKVKHYHCWLPEKRAIIDSIVDIEDIGDGWIVKEVFNNLPTAVVLERSQDYKKTRKASDI